MSVKVIVGDGRRSELRISRRGFLGLSGMGLVGATLLGTAGCGSIFGGGQDGGEDVANVLALNLTADIPGLDSTVETDIVSFNLLTNLMEGLYRLDENDEPVPAMAEGVETSEDELTYTFTLRDGVRWSNGDPVTAQDFRYAWLKALNPETASEYSYIIAQFVEGGTEYNSEEGSVNDVAIEAVDDRTLRVGLVNKSPFFLQLTTFPTYFPQQQAFVEQQGDKYAQDGDTILSNGPYVMTQGGVGVGGTTVFKKNDRYWDKSNVSVQRIDWQVVKENDTAVNLYEGGELDLTALFGSNVKKYQDNPDFYRRVEPFTTYGQFNQEVPALRNPNIRKALMLGFDRDGLADKILADGSVSAYGFVPPAITSGPGDKTFREAQGELISKDVEQARRFWERGVEELGEAPGLTLLFSDSSTQRDMATYLQDQYKKNLGADLETEIVTFEAALDRVMNKQDFEVSYAYGWIGDYDDPMTFLDLYHSDSPQNDSSYQNTRYDGLIEDARTEADLDKRMQMMLEAEKILFEDAALSPTVYNAVAGLKKPRFKNYTPHPFGGDDYKYARVES